MVFIGDQVTMEIVGECMPCERMNAIRPGLRETLDHRRGMLAMVINVAPSMWGTLSASSRKRPLQPQPVTRVA